MNYPTRIVPMVLVTAALAIGGSATASTAVAAEPGHETTPVRSSESRALIDGPLVEGPVLDIGGVLDTVQLGQFQ